MSFKSFDSGVNFFNPYLKINHSSLLEDLNLNDGYYYYIYLGKVFKSLIKIRNFNNLAIKANGSCATLELKTYVDYNITKGLFTKHSPHNFRTTSELKIQHILAEYEKLSRNFKIEKELID